MSRIFAIVVCFVAGVAFVGCGNRNLGTVRGQVTMDGKPLPNALVTFVPVEGGGASTGVTDAEGNYELGYIDTNGALIGKHKVTVTTMQKVESSASMKTLSSDDPEYMKQARGGKASDYNTAKVTEPIPPKYNAQTELEKEVKSGKNVIDLALTSK